MTVGTGAIAESAGGIRVGSQDNGRFVSTLPSALGPAGLSQMPRFIFEGVGGDTLLPSIGTRILGTKLERVGEIAQGNGETLLLVEDEPQILVLAKVMLEKLGYRVFAAATAEQALEIAEKKAGEIQLLLTDVLMPGMNGRDLAARVQTLYPDMKILFMSGYCANAMNPEGVARNGVNFIPKPFTLRMLADKVGSAVRGSS